MTNQKGVGDNTQPEKNMLENMHKINDSFFLKITNMVNYTVYEWSLQSYICYVDLKSKMAPNTGLSLYNCTLLENG